MITIKDELLNKYLDDELNREEKNLVKSLPTHLRGSKIVEKAIKELCQLGFLIKLKKTSEWHVSLNPRKKEEIYRFLGIPKGYDEKRIGF